MLPETTLVTRDHEKAQNGSYVFFILFSTTV